MLGKLNAALQLVEVALRDMVALGETGVSKMSNFPKKCVQIDVHQRRLAQMQVGFRCNLHGKQAGLAQHLEQGALPLAFVSRRFVVQLGQNLNCEITYLNDADETAEVKAIVANFEKGASVTIIVTHQRGKPRGFPSWPLAMSF